MTRYVALLRGVNVGGITVKSADLRALAEELGLDDVRTVLATGNLLFDSDEAAGKLTKRIEAGLSDRFGYDARIVLTTLDHVAAVVEAYPFEPDREGYHAYVIFGTDQKVLDAAVELAGGLDQPPEGEQVAGGDGVVYWECPKGSSVDTPFAKASAKSKDRSTTTTRNLRTLRKLL
jgi:uncharacterized protein (DUF1697 family)